MAKTVKKLKGAATPLERHVQAWINAQAQDFDEGGATGVLLDLQKGGCESGYVGHLIYYTDTVKFFKKYKTEISALLSNVLEDFGGNPVDVFGKEKWDSTDPLAMDTQNQNLLAWFGFEETAHRLASRNGVEL
jgi:hypothetical protein